MGEPFTADRVNKAVISSEESAIELKNTHCLNVLVDSVLSNPALSFEDVEQFIHRELGENFRPEQINNSVTAILKNRPLSIQQRDDISKLQKWLLQMRT